MQRCQKCSHEFIWRDVFKSITFGYKPLICKNCGVHYDVKLSFRVINALIIGIPVIISIFHPTRYMVYGYIVYIILIWLLMPFWAKYSIEKR